MAHLKDKALLKKIAFRIKKLREERNITQEVFFFDTNIHIARIETAKVNITLSTLNAVCKYFKISLVEFFNGDF